MELVVKHTMVAATTTHIVVITHIAVIAIAHIAVANTHHHFNMDLNLVIIDSLLNFVTVDIVAAGHFVSFTSEHTSITVIIELIATALIAFMIATFYFLN